LASNKAPRTGDSSPRTKNQQPSTILVTGGCGFIGSHLCERLLGLSPASSDKVRLSGDVDLGHWTLNLGLSVLCLDNFNDFYDPKLKEQNIAQLKQHPDFRLIRGDILDVDLLERIFSGSCQEPIANSQQPEAIIHLAALAGVRPSIVSPTKYVDVDIKGTVNLLEMAKKYEIKQFIFGLSSSVYGARQDDPFSENDPTDAQISPYATAKKAAELYCRTYANLYDIPTTVLRFFTVYGPRQRPEMAIHKFVRLMEPSKPIPMYGDGASARDYTYIDDCINGVMAAIERPFDFEMFNLGNSITIKLKDVIQLIADKLGVKPKIDQQPDQPGDVPITYADISKARSLLGYNPKVSLEEGIERFVEWFEKCGM